MSKTGGVSPVGKGIGELRRRGTCSFLQVPCFPWLPSRWKYITGDMHCSAAFILASFVQWHGELPQGAEDQPCACGLNSVKRPFSSSWHKQEGSDVLAFLLCTHHAEEKGNEKEVDVVGTRAVAVYRDWRKRKQVPSLPVPVKLYLVVKQHPAQPSKCYT